ncbi:dihydropyrimidinase [Lipomyces starkeyi]
MTLTLINTRLNLISLHKPGQIWRDIAVIDGVITHVGRGLTVIAGPDTRIVDAEGAHVTPGGVDTHVHLSQGAGCAVCGGTTTVVSFAAQEKWDEDVLKVVSDYHAKRASQGGTYSDYGFHLILTNPTPAVLDEQLPILRKEGGISSVKLHMPYDNRQLSDAQIMAVLAVLARTRQLGMTTMIHAENWDMIKFIIKLLEERGQTDPYFHTVSRPPLVETEAAYRAICIAELMDMPILLVHVSTKASRDHVRAAQTRMLPIHAETCPQYLYLMSDVLKMPDFEGAKYVCSPPLRDSPDDIAALWEGIANGTFTTLSSDHCPSCWDHPQGKKLGLDAKTDRKVQRDPEWFARRIIAPGYDADIVIWYPPYKALVTIENGKLHHKIDYTPYEGFQLNNWPRYTILRGKVVWAKDDGGLLGEQGYGKFVKRIGNQMRQATKVNHPFANLAK